MKKKSKIFHFYFEKKVRYLVIITSGSKNYFSFPLAFIICGSFELDVLLKKHLLKCLVILLRCFYFWCTTAINDLRLNPGTKHWEHPTGEPRATHSKTYEEAKTSTTKSQQVEMGRRSALANKVSYSVTPMTLQWLLNE